MRALLATLVALGLVVALAPAATGVGVRGVFTSPEGASHAIASFSTMCPGPATLTVTLFPATGGPSETRVVNGWNKGLPSPCDWACTNCEVPFDWIFTSNDGSVILAGGGVGGIATAWSLSGPFQEGWLTLANAGARCPTSCDIISEG